MKTMRTKLLIPLVLILLAGALLVPKAKAEVRVDAIWRTPGFSVQIDAGPRGQLGIGLRRAPLPVRPHLPQIRLLAQDRQIAARLSRYTGVPRDELLRYRGFGYTWPEIGRWLDLPRPAIRAAMERDSWQRYLDRRRSGGCLVDRQPEGRDGRDRDRRPGHGGGGRHGR